MSSVLTSFPCAPNRAEPRVTKRRPKSFPRMQQPAQSSKLNWPLNTASVSAIRIWLHFIRIMVFLPKISVVTLFQPSSISWGNHPKCFITKLSKSWIHHYWWWLHRWQRRNYQKYEEYLHFCVVNLTVDNMMQLTKDFPILVVRLWHGLIVMICIPSLGIKTVVSIMSDLPQVEATLQPGFWTGKFFLANLKSCLAIQKKHFRWFYLPWVKNI